jgi:hypothetical protein
MPAMSTAIAKPQKPMHSIEGRAWQTGAILTQRLTGQVGRPERRGRGYREKAGRELTTAGAGEVDPV